MSNVKRVRIEMNNLTEYEQLELFSNLFDFADDKLPSDKTLFISVEKNNGDS